MRGSEVTGSNGQTPHLADQALDALRSNRSGRPAVSLLTVDEALALRQVGYEPMGVVSGAMMIRVSALAGLGVSLTSNQEVGQLSQAMVEMRRTAVERMRDSAVQLGADGVVSVRLDLSDLAQGGGSVHLLAMGTAVRAAGGKDRVGRSGSCFTTGATGQELHLLTRAGYRPLGIVSGVCAYHVGRRGFGTWAGSVTSNQEMTIYTEALYDARELAMGRLQDEAISLRANGVIGLELVERSGVWGSHVIEFAVMGTAVAYETGEHQALSPRMVMDLAAGT